MYPFCARDDNSFCYLVSARRKSPFARSLARSLAGWVGAFIHSFIRDLRVAIDPRVLALRCFKEPKVRLVQI